MRLCGLVRGRWIGDRSRLNAPCRWTLDGRPDVTVLPAVGVVQARRGEGGPGMGRETVRATDPDSP